jgi:peroxiredoxin
MKLFTMGFIAVLCAAACASAAARDVTPLEIGAAAPDFRLPGVDGKMYSLADFANAKVLMVVFTCNHCPTAQAYEDRLIQLHRDYRDRGVAVVAISPNDPLAVRLDELGYTDLSDSFDEMKIRAKDKGFEFPYLYDGETQATSAGYGVLATPHVFMFDQQRRLRYAGRIDDSEVGTVTSHDARNALDALLAGQSVPMPTTRVFGCSTKWADKREDGQRVLARWNQEPVQLQLIDEQGVRALVQNSTEKYRLINVWATWCAPCVEELPEFVTMHRMYRQRKFEWITLSADDPKAQADALKLLTDKHASATNYLFNSTDRDKLFDSVDKQWQGAIPYTILVAPGGEVVYRKHGPIDPLELKKAIVERIGRTYAFR